MPSRPAAGDIPCSRSSTTFPSPSWQYSHTPRPRGSSGLPFPTIGIPKEYSQLQEVLNSEDVSRQAGVDPADPRGAENGSTRGWHGGGGCIGCEGSQGELKSPAPPRRGPARSGRTRQQRAAPACRVRKAPATTPGAAAAPNPCSCDRPSHRRRQETPAGYPQVSRESGVRSDVTTGATPPRCV